MQLVMPSVVAMAVRNEMAICNIVFQVSLFIAFYIFLKLIILVCFSLGFSRSGIAPQGLKTFSLFDPFDPFDLLDLREAEYVFLSLSPLVF